MALPYRTTGSLKPTFVSARLVGLAVNQVYAFAPVGGFPSRLNLASRPSVTVWEATAPVKLPAFHCPSPGLRVQVRTTERSGWYLTVGSSESENPDSKPPTYPAQTAP